MNLSKNKLIRNALICSSIVAMLLATGCSKTQNKTTNQNNNQNSNQNTTQNANSQNQGGGQPGAGGNMGIITAISDTSITVAQMPAGSGPQGGGKGGDKPSGTAPSGTAPSGSDAPQGTPPPQPSGSAPSGSGAPSATMDTSSWTKTTWTIDSSTKIVQGQGPDSKSTSSTTLKLSDLKVGDSVSITARSGQATVADQISVMTGGMGGQGGPQGGQGAPQGSAPAATTKSN